MDNLAVANIIPSSSNVVSSVTGVGLDAAAGSGAGLSAEAAFGELLGKQIALLDPNALLVDDIANADDVSQVAVSTIIPVQAIDPALLIQQISTPFAQEADIKADITEDDALSDLGEVLADAPPVDPSTLAIVIPVGNLPPTSAAVVTPSGKDLPPALAATLPANQALNSVVGDQVISTNIQANTQAEISDEFAAALAARIGTEKSRVVISPDATQNQSQIQAQHSLSTQAQIANAAPVGAGIPQQVGSPHWDTSLGDKVVWMLGTNTKVAELHLNPPALGPLEVRISMSDGQANLSFMTQHNAVGEAIEIAKGRLREMMGESGVNMGNVSVNVGSFAQQQQQQQAQQQSSSQTPDGKTATDITWLPEGEGGESVTSTVQSLREQGLVDLFA